MKLRSVHPVYSGESISVQKAIFDESGESKEFDRIRKGTSVIAICHDVVNSNVILNSQYLVGAMQTIHDLPQGHQESSEDALQAVKRIVKDTTGCEVKSAQIIQEFMRSPEVDFNPTILFYCTIDSRETLDSDDVLAVPARQLIREVEDCMHESQMVVMAGWYLKMLNKGFYK